MRSDAIGTLLLVILVFTGTVTAGKKEFSTSQKAFDIVKTIQKYHYKPRPVDDTLSRLIFDRFLESLDPNGCFFTNEMIGDLERYRYEIDDQIKNRKSIFLDTVAIVFRKQLVSADSLIKSSG